MESKRITKVRLVIIAVCIGLLGAACQNPEPTNTSTYSKDVLKVREQKNYNFSNPETSPVLDMATFKGLHFFPVNEEFRVQGKITSLKGSKEVLLQTTTDKYKRYLEFASITFQLKGEEYTVTAFQEPDKPKELFIPFRDGTNQTDDTYKGGRYLNTELESGENVIIDFNLAYHPYCLFNPEYVCPLPPEENSFPIRIEAGERL